VLTADLVNVGTHVKIAGNGGSRARDDIMWINNMLLPSGEENPVRQRPFRRAGRSATIGTDTRAAVRDRYGRQARTVPGVDEHDEPAGFLGRPRKRCR